MYIFLYIYLHRLKYLFTNLFNYLQGLIKWIQNTEIVGFESSSTIINFAVLIIDSTEYIELCFKSKDNISYADLGATIDQFFDQILLDCPKNTRLSLILIDLEGSLNKYVRNTILLSF